MEPGTPPAVAVKVEAETEDGRGAAAATRMPAEANGWLSSTPSDFWEREGATLMLGPVEEQFVLHLRKVLMQIAFENLSSTLYTCEAAAAAGERVKCARSKRPPVLLAPLPDAAPAKGSLRALLTERKLMRASMRSGRALRGVDISGVAAEQFEALRDCGMGGTPEDWDALALRVRRDPELLTGLACLPHCLRRVADGRLVMLASTSCFLDLHAALRTLRKAVVSSMLDATISAHKMGVTTPDVSLYIAPHFNVLHGAKVASRMEGLFDMDVLSALLAEVHCPTAAHFLDSVHALDLVEPTADGTLLPVFNPLTDVHEVVEKHMERLLDMHKGAAASPPRLVLVPKDLERDHHLLFGYAFQLQHVGLPDIPSVVLTAPHVALPAAGEGQVKESGAFVPPLAPAPSFVLRRILVSVFEARLAAAGGGEGDSVRVGVADLLATVQAGRFAALLPGVTDAAGLLRMLRGLCTVEGLFEPREGAVTLSLAAFRTLTVDTPVAYTAAQRDNVAEFLHRAYVARDKTLMVRGGSLPTPAHAAPAERKSHSLPPVRDSAISAVAGAVLGGGGGAGGQPTRGQRLTDPGPQGKRRAASPHLWPETPQQPQPQRRKMLSSNELQRKAAAELQARAQAPRGVHGSSGGAYGGPRFGGGWSKGDAARTRAGGRAPGAYVHEPPRGPGGSARGSRAKDRRPLHLVSPEDVQLRPYAKDNRLMDSSTHDAVMRMQMEERLLQQPASRSAAARSSEDGRPPRGHGEARRQHRSDPGYADGRRPQLDGPSVGGCAARDLPRTHHLTSRDLQPPPSSSPHRGRTADHPRGVRQAAQHQPAPRYSHVHAPAQHGAAAAPPGNARPHSSQPPLEQLQAPAAPQAYGAPASYYNPQAVPLLQVQQPPMQTGWVDAAGMHAGNGFGAGGGGLHGQVLQPAHAVQYM